MFFKSHWGFATNGRKVTLFVRIKNKHGNKLIAGKAMDWDDPLLMQTMTGFNFASIDDQLRPGLREFLCAGSVLIMNPGDHGGGGGDGGNEDGGNSDGGNEDGGNSDGDNSDGGATGRDHNNNGGRQGGGGHNTPGDGPSGINHGDQGRADNTTGETMRRSTRIKRTPSRGRTMVQTTRSKPSATSAPSTSKTKQ